MESWFVDVATFCKACRKYIGDMPYIANWIDKDDGLDIVRILMLCKQRIMKQLECNTSDVHVVLHVNLILEEMIELIGSILYGEIHEVATESVDVIYVVIGAALAFGIDLRPVWNAVHEANMLKAGGPVREDGKQLKPVDWEPANIAKIITDQGPLKI